MRLQQVVLEEIRSGINILQKQDSTIVEEASEVFQGIHRQPANAAKKNIDNTVQLIAIKAMISKLKDDFRLWRTTQQSLENKVELIEKRIKDLPTKDDLRAHAKAMEVAMARVQEVNTGLTTAMGHYKFSESTSHRPRSVAAGLCGIHPSRSDMFGSDYALLTREDDGLSVDKRRKTMDLYIKEREGKPNADCQSRSPMPSTNAEPSSLPWGQVRLVGAGEANGSRKPPATFPSPPAPNTREATGPNP